MKISKQILFSVLCLMMNSQIQAISALQAELNREIVNHAVNAYEANANNPSTNSSVNPSTYSNRTNEMENPELKQKMMPEQFMSKKDMPATFIKNAASAEKFKNVIISIRQGKINGPIAYGNNIPLIAQPKHATDTFKIAIPDKLENISVYLKDLKDKWMEFVISVEPTNESEMGIDDNNPPYLSTPTQIIKKDALKKGLYVFVTVVEDVKNLKGRYFNINVATDKSLKPIATMSFLAPYKGDGDYYYNMNHISIQLNNEGSPMATYWVPNPKAEKGQAPSIFDTLSKVFFIQESQKKLVGAEPMEEMLHHTLATINPKAKVSKVTDSGCDYYGTNHTPSECAKIKKELKNEVKNRTARWAEYEKEEKVQAELQKKELKSALKDAALAKDLSAEPRTLLVSVPNLKKRTNVFISTMYVDVETKEQISGYDYQGAVNSKKNFVTVHIPEILQKSARSGGCTPPPGEGCWGPQRAINGEAASVYIVVDNAAFNVAYSDLSTSQDGTSRLEVNGKTATLFKAPHKPAPGSKEEEAIPAPIQLKAQIA